MAGNKTIIWLVVLIVVAGGSFYGGMKYQMSQVPARGTGTFAGRTGTTGTRAGGVFTSGTVVSTNATGLTLQTANGSSMNVFFGTSTEVLKTTTGSPSDLTAETNVMITGSTNSDGSITAQSISIRPTGMTGFGGAGAAGSGSQTQTQ